MSWYCLVQINSVLWNILCVWILLRTLAVILASDVSFFLNIERTSLNDASLFQEQKIQDYFKTWLNINHITGHSNIYCIF